MKCWRPKRKRSVSHKSSLWPSYFIDKGKKMHFSLPKASVLYHHRHSFFILASSLFLFISHSTHSLSLLCRVDFLLSDQRQKERVEIFLLAVGQRFDLPARKQKGNSQLVAIPPTHLPLSRMLLLLEINCRERERESGWIALVKLNQDHNNLLLLPLGYKSSLYSLGKEARKRRGGMNHPISSSPLNFLPSSLVVPFLFLFPSCFLLFHLSSNDHKSGIWNQEKKKRGKKERGEEKGKRVKTSLSVVLIRTSFLHSLFLSSVTDESRRRDCSYQSQLSVTEYTSWHTRRRVSQWVTGSVSLILVLLLFLV